MHSIGLNGLIYMGGSGLQTTQLETNIAGTNLGNTSVTGASRQRVIVKSDVSVNIGGTDLSIGVYSPGVVGTRSVYLDQQVQQENSNLGSATNIDNFMGEVESAIQESLTSSQVSATDTSTQTGLESATSNFYNAWSTLASDPTSQPDRDAISTAAQSFVSTATTIYNQLMAVKSSVFTEAGSEVSTVNNLTTEIGALNKQIAAAEVSSSLSNGMPINQANTLRDQRQNLIEQLGSIVNITTTQNAKNSSMTDITLTDNPSISLVSGIYGGGASNGSGGNVTYSLSSNSFAAGNSLTVTATTTDPTTTPASTTVTPTGGSLGGLVYTDNTLIGAQSTNPAVFKAGTTIIDKFNTYLNNVITSVNAATSGGFDVNGNAGQAFFYNSATSTASTGAFDLRLNDIYNLNNTSYSSDYIPAAKTSVGQLDADNATAIANSQTNASILPYYTSLVSQIGSIKQESANNLQAQQLMSTQVNNQRESYSGISTDEEMTDLVTFQRAYEASARFINIVDQMYQTLTQNLGN